MGIPLVCFLSRTYKNFNEAQIRINEPFEVVCIFNYIIIFAKSFILTIYSIVIMDFIRNIRLLAFP